MENVIDNEFEARRREMLNVNVTQAQLYDEIALQKSAENTQTGGVSASESRNNIAFRIWAAIKRKRRLVQEMTGMDNYSDKLHREWVDDAAGMNVLELGCNVGHENTFSIAGEADSYLGVDLSPKAIDEFNNELSKRNLVKARGMAADFLSPEFPDQKFDLVLARAVVHHFQHFDTFLSILHSRMEPNGVVLTFDPLQTALTAQAMRAVYRPFQADKDWEWPLSKSSFEAIEKYFVIEKVQGFLGKSKWAIPVAMLNQNLARILGTKWHAQDIERASEVGPGLWPCLFVVMKLRRKELT